ncbi:MAG TPA: hypothetical protein DCX54_01595 [Flavobacteriales bacterium]|nr:hypothetical protein [Flavobacteriales bacterium]
MSEIENKNNSENESLLSRIESLENRLTHIESRLRIEWVGKKEPAVGPSGIPEEHEEDSTESRIVEYGLAWLGSIVFSFGIVFLMSYLESLGYPVMSVAIAYIAAFMFIPISYFMRKSFPTLVNVLNIVGPILLFYITLRMHFFAEEPLLANQTLVLILMLVVVGFQLYNGIRKNSEFLGSVAIILGIITAILSDSAYIIFSLLTLMALGAALLFHIKLWWKLHIFTLFLVYITHLLWLFGNPSMGHPMGIVESPEHNILFLFAYGIIFSLSILIPTDKLESNTGLISISLWNALGFSFVLLLLMPSFYAETYPMMFSAISLYCLLFAVFLKLKVDRNFAPATYASFGFMAFSIAIYGFTGLPDSYFLLVLQSLLVVTLALWFRSQIIVVANAFLFVSILFLFLFTSESIDLINFSFVFTALVTARILGWQKERLTLKTEIFRNIYLLIASFMILYSLNQAVPSHYVTFSWTATAIGFFLMSILLRNIKYRYLSIFVFVVTGGHLFFVDLGKMDVGYRVIAFLLFAIISIGVSLYYTKRIRKK